MTLDVIDIESVSESVIMSPQESIPTDSYWFGVASLYQSVYTSFTRIIILGYITNPKFIDDNLSQSAPLDIEITCESICVAFDVETPDFSFR